MTALSDALDQAQRSAIAAIGKTYVHEPFDADIARDALDKIGCRDKTEQTELIEAWALLNAYGGNLPTTGAFRLPQQSSAPNPPELATKAQRDLISKISRERDLPLPDQQLTKQQAHEWIANAKR